MFPEGQNEGLYHTADATLWFFHAVDRYVAGHRRSRPLCGTFCPKLDEIVDHAPRGTRFGIGVDPADGLLRQGAQGYQLTWMDAKVGDWVVTPRRGKAVEINALLVQRPAAAGGLAARATQHDGAAPIDMPSTRNGPGSRSIDRFWYDAGGYLYDVVDGETGDDPACRPNQLLAFSLEHPVLDRSRWPAVLEVVRQRLLTPVGLRSLAPGSRITSRAISATSARATRPTIRARSGPG